MAGDVTLIGPQVAALTRPEAGGLARLESAAARGDAQEAAERFEALLATMLVKELRRTLSNDFFGDGPGADVYGGWLDEHLGESLAAGWDLDLAGMVRTSLERKQATQGEV